MSRGTWLASPGDKYGGSIASADTKNTADATATVTVAPVTVPSLTGLLSPADPMFWFGAIAAAAVGLMAYSTVVPG